MADAKPRKARHWALGIAALALGWLFGVWPPPVWWRDHWPRETAMMREAADGHAAARVGSVRPAALHHFSPLLPRMVILGEDSRFRAHHGIDLAELAEALDAEHGTTGVWPTVTALWRRRDRVRGASTITQQLAKNLYLSAARNPLRKVKEAVTALRLELALSKDRILELYLTVAEWGPGVWGAEAASRVYFDVPASCLDEAQAAALAATLPHPLTSNPTLRPEPMLARRDLILARYHGVAVYLPPEPEEEGDGVLAVPPVNVPPSESLPPTAATPPARAGVDSARARNDSR